MALIFADGFEQYGAITQLSRTYIDVLTTGSNLQLVTGRGGIGTACFIQPGVGTDGYFNQALANLSTGYIGFAFKTDSLPADGDICAIGDPGAYHSTIQLTSDGQLHVTRGRTTKLANSAAKRIKANIWYYIEWKFEVANSTTGTVEVRVNEETWISLSSGADTQNSANAYATNVSFNSNLQGSGAFWTYDDIYICDTTGGVNDTYLGDIRVTPLTPNANGNYSQFTGSDGNSTNNYELIDDATPDDDTTYVESSTVNDRDSYGFGNLSVTPTTISAVVLWTVVKKTDAGTRSGKLFTRISTTDYDGDEFFPSQNDYTNEYHIWDQDPSTVAAWTESAVNAFEGGVKVHS